MKVRRSMPEAGWVPVANTAARDHRLSWRARGLLLELLSYPDGWDLSVDTLVAKARATGKATEGRNAMRNAIGELNDLGYVKYVRGQDDEGHWTTEMAVSDEPDPTVQPRRTGNRTDGAPDRRGAETSGDRGVGGRYGTKNTDTETVKNTGQEDQKEHSSTLVSLASSADFDTKKTRNEQLQRIYSHVDKLEPDALRRGLLKLERKRPAIYRDCRQRTLAQLEQEMGADALKSAATEVDRLSLKYAAVHYVERWPMWFADAINARELNVAA